MMNSRRSATRISLIAAPFLLAAAVILHPPAFSQTPAPAPVAVAQADGSLFDYADHITRLVQNGKIDELARLEVPARSSQVTRLHDWATEYVGDIKKQEQQRDKQYNEAITKGQDQFKLGHYDKAMERIVAAYRIAKDPEAFLKLDWMKDLTAKVAARAAELERKGSWLESLQLYTDLNTLYEVETRYKPDMQRLARRTRLIAVYAPKTLFDMRKALLEQDKDPSDPATSQPSTMDEDPGNFTRWQDYVENISIDMMKDAIGRSVDDWVQETTYDTLINGGVEALRLFLTTPELRKEFPGLNDPSYRKTFDDALNGALALSGSKKDMNADDVEKMVKDIIRASNNSVKLPAEVLIMEFTDGAMEKLDPFTAAIWPHEVDEFEKNTRGSFGGVGVQISLEKDTDAAKAQLKNLDKTLDAQNPEIEKDMRVGGKFRLVVVSPLPDTPAIKAGIQAGDVITGIDGKSTVGISIDQAVHTIMGAPGTPVRLRIKRGDEWEKEFSLNRDVIKVGSIKGVRRNTTDNRWNFMLDDENKVGYVNITGFQEDTADDLKQALTSLEAQGVRGVILDLRFNPGGLLNAAVEISDMFLQDGVIVSTRGRSIRSRPQEWHAHSDTVLPPNMPVVVLVNEYSASASEIFSGAMKDLHRALIVGHRSFGKGSVQNLLKMGSEMRPDGNPEAMMKLTMAYYYLPNGESLHRKDRSKNWGVDPDIAVDLTQDQLADLLKSRRDADIIHPAGTPASAPATRPAAPDTQLETALLMMRLQLVQATGGA
jgi:carboxyl-terminal processing protease